MNNPNKLKKFDYKIKQSLDLTSYYIQFDIRHVNHSAKIGLTYADTLELWLTYAEMPEILSSHLDEKIWEAHRKYILAMLADHFHKDIK
ncbi:hypothetical protein J7J47_03720 [Halomonas sp. ISL-60]|nr:hypothetical protein [Halomonas sp. ISL-60]MBT2800695.1 hypothetical protein [Halomonas sp. ISL-56]